MFRLSSLRLLLIAVAGVVLALPAAESTAQTAAAQPGQQATPGPQVGPSGLPLPRFVSLKAGKVNSRIGPGVNYAVDWQYLKPGLPMEIIQEYDNWRRVRDPDGAEGWVYQSLLSGERTGIAAPWQKGKDVTIDLRAGPDAGARLVAMVEPGVVGSIRNCDGAWCEMTFGSRTGWVSQSQVWGAYPGELVRN